MEQELLTHAKLEFFDAMCQREPVNALIRAAYKVLGWPVILGDNASNVILQVPDREIGSREYDKLLAERRVDPDLYVMFQDSMKKVYNPKGESVQVVPGEDEQYPLQVCVTVHIYGAMFAQAFFHVPCEEITAEQHKVLTLLFHALTAECLKLARREPLAQKRMRHHMRLLIDGERDEAILRRYADGLEKDIPGNYILFVTLLEKDKRQESFFPFFVEQVERSVQTPTLSIFYQGNIVTLCGGLNRNTEPLELRGLTSFLESCTAVAGSTMCFSGSLTKLKYMYQQALLTARLGQKLCPKERVFPFDSLSPFQVFVPAEESYSPYAFLPPKLVKVIEWDQKNGTEYLKTIQAYLVASRNNKDGAQLLAVHQNTLLYRITKIKELFDIDFLDGKTNLEMLVSILFFATARPDLLPLFSGPNM